MLINPRGIKAFSLLSFIWVAHISCSQQDDSTMVNRIYSEALSSNIAYHNLEQLCRQYPGRMPGSANLLAAIDYTRKVMKQMKLDSVYLQPLTGPNWKPGDKPIASIYSRTMGKHNIVALPLGNSVGTSKDGISATIVEVKSFKDLEVLGQDRISGKIVFFNRPMDPSMANTFAAYGQAVDQRTEGAGMAARYGAVAVLVRSVTTSIDTIPHTGVMHYNDGINKIPAIAISTADADILSRWLKTDPETKCSFRINCQTYSSSITYNVVGEVRGSIYPDQIITVGGHLDCWYNTEGAHDDASGCIQSIELLRIFHELGILPRHTIRVLMFVDEEMTQAGAKKYAELARLSGEKHILAMESDRGGFEPSGIGISSGEEAFSRFLKWQKYFTPYGILEFTKGGGGVDISPLGRLGAITVSTIPECQRYFDYHHSAADAFEAVNKRELQLGSAAMAAFIYLADKYGI